MKQLLFGLVFIVKVFCQYTPDWASLDSRPLPSWYDEAKVCIRFRILKLESTESVRNIYSLGSVLCSFLWLRVILFRLEKTILKDFSDAGEWYWWSLDGARDSCTLEYHNKTYGPDFTYPEFGPMFDASLFDANEWAEVRRLYLLSIILL